MNWLAITISAAIFFPLLFLLYRVFVRTLREKACFAMYATRDDLIYLVACGRLEEESPVFRHYYSRVNDLLAETPNVGIDDILHRVFAKWQGGDFEKMLKRAKGMADRLFEDPAFEDTEVRRVVASYYRGVEFLILSHSSILRMLYLLLRRASSKFGQRLSNWMLDIIPGRYRRAIGAVRYASTEAQSVCQCPGGQP